jgi:hypothetical protein
LQLQEEKQVEQAGLGVVQPTAMRYMILQQNLSDSPFV